MRRYAEGFPGRALVHVAEGAGAGAPGIAAGSAGAAGWGCRRRRALCRDREDRQLRFQFLGVAFRALGFFLAVDELFKLVMAFLADVLEDGYGRLQFLLESICAQFANSRPSESSCVDGPCAVPGTALARRRPCADHCQLSAPPQN